MITTFQEVVVRVSIFTLIFMWVFLGWLQIWQNPSIPPKMQEARAATGDVDIGRWTDTATSLIPTESWAAPNGMFSAQARNDNSTYTFTDSTASVDIGTVDADGYLIVVSFEFEDTSDGRFNPQGKIVQTSGTGTFVSSFTSGYSRDTSEDRAFVRTWAFVDSPSAGADFQFQWKRDTDAPTGGTFTSSFDIIPLYYSDFGAYSSTDAAIFGSTAPNVVTGFTGTDGTNITRSTDVITVAGDNKRYLIFGSWFLEGLGGRTQRIGGFDIDGTQLLSAQGYAYARNSSNDEVGAMMTHLMETVTADRTIEMTLYRGDGILANQGGAVADGSIPTVGQHALVVIELNDSAEVFHSTDGTGNVDLNVTGPVDISISRVDDITFNDSASFTRVSSDEAMDATVAMDALLGANLWAAQEVVSATTRWTARAHFTVNGTEDADTKHGNYARNDQGTLDTFGWSANLLSFVALSQDDNFGVSIQELAGGEDGGTFEINPDTAGFWGINLNTLAGNAEMKQQHYRWRNDDGAEEAFDKGDGDDGAVSLSANLNVNTQTIATYPVGVAYRVGKIDGSEISLRNAAGPKLGNTNGIETGDEILLINLQGSTGDQGDNGNYEFLEVQSVSGGTITVSSAPLNTYDGSGDSYTNQKVYVQRVPNFTNVTTNAYDILTSAFDLADHDDSSATDNAYTGIVVFRANGTVTVSSGGSITAAGLGYGGGAYGVYDTDSFGDQGESTTGTGSDLQGSNEGGGGGGLVDTGSVSGASGGGGGYATVGGNGDDSPNDANSGGLAGGTYGIAELTSIYLGSGGGGGGSDNVPIATDGAAGGGILMIVANFLVVQGTVTADGAGSVSSGSEWSGTGGGGSGGSIYVAASTVTLGSGLVTAGGGTGECGDTGRCGGDGGNGRIRVEADTINGTTSPGASTDGTPGGAGASFLADEDRGLTDVETGSSTRIRFIVSNEGTMMETPEFHLEVAQTANCSAGSYTSLRTDYGGHWNVATSTNITDGEPTLNISPGLTDPGGGRTFTSGELKDTSASTSAITLSNTQFTEVEFSVEAVPGNAVAEAQYCFRLTDAGNASLFTYSIYATATIAEVGGALSSDIVDSGGSPVSSPSVSMTTSSFSFSFQTATGTLGISEQKIRVNNTTANPEWSLTIAANTTTAFWDGATVDYDFNDATASAGDGADADSLGGEMTIDPSGASISPEGGCSDTGLTLGGSASFNEGTTDSITIVTAGDTADTSCYWDFTDIDVSQTIPAEQGADSYAIDLVLTLVAV